MQGGCSPAAALYCMRAPTTFLLAALGDPGQPSHRGYRPVGTCLLALPARQPKLPQQFCFHCRAADQIFRPVCVQIVDGSSNAVIPVDAQAFRFAPADGAQPGQHESQF